jgi:hypothetical protein
MVILTDNQQDWNYIPTGANMMAAFHWLVSGNHPGDSHFLHYSGHGVCCPSPHDKVCFLIDRQGAKSRIQMATAKVDSTTLSAL